MGMQQQLPADATLKLSMLPGFHAASKTVFAARTCTQQKALREHTESSSWLGGVRRSSARSVHSVGTTDSEAPPPSLFFELLRCMISFWVLARRSIQDSMSSASAAGGVNEEDTGRRRELKWHS